MDLGEGDSLVAHRDDVAHPDHVGGALLVERDSGDEAGVHNDDPEPRQRQCVGQLPQECQVVPGQPACRQKSVTALGSEQLASQGDHLHRALKIQNG